MNDDLDLSDLHQVDVICSRFEAALQRGEHPCVIDYLVEHRLFRKQLALELVRVQLHHLRSESNEFLFSPEQWVEAQRLKMKHRRGALTARFQWRVDIETGPHSGQSINLDESAPLVIGRDEVGAIVLDQDQAVSREHAVITVCEYLCGLRDLKSTNGTFLKDQRIQEALIAPNDTVRVGKSVLRFHLTLVKAPFRPATNLPTPPENIEPINTQEIVKLWEEAG